MKKFLPKLALFIAIALAVFVPVAEAARTQSSWLYDSSGYIFPAQTPVNVLISGINRYLNFGTFSGSSGYGFRDNAGSMEFKNNGGVWTGIGTGGGGGVGTSTNPFMATYFVATSTTKQSDFYAGLTAGTADIGVPGNLNGVISYGAGANGDYFAFGNSFGAAVVAYKVLNGVKYFASAGTNPITLDDDNSNNNMYVVFTWDPVAGADGYRVFFQDNYYLFANYDYYYDTTGTTISLGKAAPNAGVENGTTPGTTQTPILGKTYITSAGLVGVRTSNPLSSLDVSGNIAVGSYAGATAAPSNGLAVSGDTIIGTGADVGAQLQVYGGTNIYGTGFPQFNVVNSGDALAGVSLNRSGGPQWLFYRYGTQPVNSDRFCIGQNGVSEPFCFTSGSSGGMIVGSTYTSAFAAPTDGALFQGKVFIGTGAALNSSTDLLQVNGAIDMPNGAALNSFDGSGNKINLIYTGGGNADVNYGGTNVRNLIFNTGSVEGFRILQAGNAGFGVSAPTYKLDVAGNGHFTLLVDAKNFVATSTTATSTFSGGLYVAQTSSSTAPYIYSKTSGFGGHLIMEDEGGGACTEITTKAGVVKAAVKTCPTEI